MERTGGNTVPGAPIRVITISRQLASRGHDVAKVAAERLGFRLVFREVINEAAIRSRAPEAALAAIDELGLLGLCPSPQACRDYRDGVAEVINELAEEGRIIIVGRAGQAILRSRTDTLHVRIIAPMPQRIAYLVNLHGISAEAARAQIDASDAHRKKYMQKFYKVRWSDPDLYDLIINTGRLTVGDAAELLYQYAAPRLPEVVQERS
jgi:cytidylate kinase